jgi:ATP-binding cassette subfamily B protein
LLIDGRDIRTFDLTQYRRQLGIVSQVPFLFSGTVADNIRYAAPGVRKEMLQIAKKIGDGEWLETLPEWACTPKSASAATRSRWGSVSSWR